MPVGNTIHKAPSLSNEGINKTDLNEAKRSLSEQIKNIEQKAFSQYDTLKNEKKSTFSWLKDLKSISEKHGDNSIVRFKNGQFKYGKSSSKLKRLFNIDKTRIKSERQEAATRLSKLTSAKEESATSKGLTNAIEKHLGTLEHKLETSLDKLDDLEQQLDSVRNEHLKAINEQWDSIPLPQNDSKPKKVRFGDVKEVTFDERAPIAPKKQVTKGSTTHSKANQSDQAQASPLDKLLGKQRQLQSKIDACRDNTDFRGERAAKMYEKELKLVNQQLSALSKQQQRSRGTSIATRGTTASRAQKITELSNHIAQLKREKADCENSGYKNADREARLVESKIKQVESELEALLNA
ncbi:hypothetical protein GCM10007938_13980 [Vibrio zhanjiangensis]|uniref:Uncharacterized protein n=1 Tax=Vibrio zhanjiangensis TaxID=1046128 RepID=A0ABQ6EWR3_9VIBR|nr:hypothetical protein [Vibrio zhanjiangensis]GLT17620.1 hypothetical protein GCM10007938_13980 [Vibrio zhanjiangensis]